MDKIDIFRILRDYNLALTQRVWESVQQLTEEQFVQNILYSRGSIRRQMVHWQLPESADCSARKVISGQGNSGLIRTTIPRSGDPQLISRSDP